jgi:epoxyqueuosine reductase
VDLVELLTLDERAFRVRFRGTPIFRTKRRGVLRNAALIVGNQRYGPAEPVLCKLLDDHEALLRGAAAWALGQLGTPHAIAALHSRFTVETDLSVIEEIRSALEGLPNQTNR